MDIYKHTYIHIQAHTKAPLSFREKKSSLWLQKCLACKKKHLTTMSSTAYLVPKSKSMRKCFIAVTGHWVTKAESTQPGTPSHEVQSGTQLLLSRNHHPQGSSGLISSSWPELLLQSWTTLPLIVWQYTEQPQKDCKTSVEWIKKLSWSPGE